MNTTLDHDALRAAWTTEMNSAKAARGACNHAKEWQHLERAHIISQPLAARHVRTHIAMLRFAVRTLDIREGFGQLFRIVVAAPGTWTGRYPAGNTGGANVSAFVPMPLPDDLRSLLGAPTPAQHDLLAS